MRRIVMAVSDYFVYILLKKKKPQWFLLLLAVNKRMSLLRTFEAPAFSKRGTAPCWVFRNNAGSFRRNKKEGLWEA